MGKTLFKKLTSCSSSISSVVLFIIFSSNGIADNLENQMDNMDNIVLIDETENSLMKQDKIIGCDDSLKINELKCSKERTPADRDKDIDEIKAQLSDILKQLAELKKEKDIRTKDTKLNTIKKSIKKLTIDTRDSNITHSYSKPKEIKEIERNEKYIVVEVQSGESLSKYAQKYYGDNRKYYRIYLANKDKISEDLQIYIGDKLIVPISDSYTYNELKKTKDDINISKKDNNKTKPNFANIKKNIKKVNHNNMLIKKLDKVIYVEDEEKIDTNNSDFIPLQDNISLVENQMPKSSEHLDIK